MCVFWYLVLFLAKKVFSIFIVIYVNNLISIVHNYNFFFGSVFLLECGKTHHNSIVNQL